MDVVPTSESQPAPLPPGVSPALELRFQDLEEFVRTRRPKDDPAALRQAFEFAAARHSAQLAAFPASPTWPTRSR